MDGDSGPSNSRKRYRIEDMALRLLISSKAAGGIIGRGGTNIKGLREKYSATLTVPDNPGPERVVNIGADNDVAVSILEELLPQIEEAAASSRGDNSSRKPDTEVRLLVHTMQAGSIIGRSGFKIKELRESTGAQVRVFSETCPNSTDRVTVISGDREKVMDCVRSVMKLLEENPPKGSNMPYDAKYFDEMHASEYGGFSDDHDDFGRSFRSGYRSQMRHGSPRGSMPPRGGFGPPPPRSRPGPMRSGFRGGMEPPQDDYRRRSRGDRDETETQRFSIPKSAAGAIIGMGGSRIRQIRSESCCNISIDDTKQGANERIITITGSPDQVQLAQFLLQKSVRENGGMGDYD